MCHRRLSVCLGIIFTFCFFAMSKAQNLVARECSARLPTPRREMTVLYDGNDSIYLFGGYDRTTFALNQTLKYSISLDTLEPAGQLPLPLGSFHGGAMLNKHGEIFYIAGAYYNDILQYFPDSRTFTKVGSIPGATREFAAVMPDEDTAFLLGGQGNYGDVTSLDMNTFTSEVIHRLPATASDASGIWVEEQGAAYVFDRIGNYTIQKYTRATNVSALIPISQARDYGQVVWDGNFGYLIGGYPVYRDVIVQFDPRTETLAEVQVEGHPGENIFYSTDAVYVEKCNRIYLFGGGPLGQRHNQIWYITSNQSCSILPPQPTTTTESTPIPTMDPEVFDCSTRPTNAAFAYPGDCSKFIICRGGHGYAFECPNPLLFHPFLHCTINDLVECE